MPTSMAQPVEHTTVQKLAPQRNAAAVSVPSEEVAASCGARRDDARAGKYLTFRLGPEEYGIRVLRVREIMGLQDVTAVPGTPHHVKGVINLRGKVIPVVCLRSKFGLAPEDYTAHTCIVVVQVARAAGPVLVGAIVDAVCEVLNIGASDIEDTPNFGSAAATPYLLGMAKIKEKVKILLDIDQAVGPQEWPPA